VLPGPVEILRMRGLGAAMQLRAHPLMTYRGSPNWPPAWIQVRETTIKSLSGEVGILKHVMRYDRVPNGFVLAIEYDGEQYLGFLIFDHVSFCMLIYDLLETRVGCSIEDLGSLDMISIL
jgi:hypothetical protein